MKVFTISAALAELWPESVASIHRFEKKISRITAASYQAIPRALSVQRAPMTTK